MSNELSAFDIITGGTSSITDDVVLSSVFEIENILIHINDLNSKLDHLKGLKKYRVETADVEIKSIEGQILQLRELIQRTMFTLKPDENNLLFPSVGKIVKRKGSTSWVIKDEDAFLEYMKQEGRYDEITKTKVSVDARAAKKVISDLVDSGEDVPGVEQIEGGPSISITFEDDAPRLSKTTTKGVPAKAPAKAAPKLATKQDLDDLDDLDV